jgi:hypothetical protein
MKTVPTRLGNPWEDTILPVPQPFVEQGSYTARTRHLMRIGSDS